MKKQILTKMDLDCFYEKLENGLELYVIPSSSNSTYVTFTARYGSNDNVYLNNGEKVVKPLGVAHFLEHKMFETNGGVDPFTFYSSNGADANANTNYYKTTYLFSGCQHFSSNLNFLLD